MESLPAADMSRSGVRETAVSPNSNEKQCCIPVDREGEQNDPIGAAFITWLGCGEYY